MPKTRKEILLSLYTTEPDYVALRMCRLFEPVVTEQDRVLHNEMSDEIAEIFKDNPPKGFYTAIVRLVVAKKDFIKRVIETIRDFGMRRSETK